MYQFEERDEKNKHEKGNSSNTSPFSPTFHFKEFKVGNLENASTINIGNNYPSNFKGYKRHSQGLGTIEGNHNDIHDLKSHMSQKVLLDALMEGEEELPDWVKELIYNHKDEFMNEESDHNESEELLEQVKSLLGTDRAPAMFLKLSEHKELLEKIVKYMTSTWSTSQAFHLFYEDVLKLLHDIQITIGNSSLTPLNHDVCELLADSIEAQAKTLLVVTHLTYLLLPGYLLQLEYEIINDPSSINMNHMHESSIEKIEQAIKSGFQLSELPQSLSFLKDYPEISGTVFNHILRPLLLSGRVEAFLHLLKERLVNKSKTITNHIPLKLTTKEQGILFPLLISSLQNYPKYILLEYVFLPFYVDSTNL